MGRETDQQGLVASPDSLVINICESVKIHGTISLLLITMGTAHPNVTLDTRCRVLRRGSVHLRVEHQISRGASWQCASARSYVQLWVGEQQCARRNNRNIIDSIDQTPPHCQTTEPSATFFSVALSPQLPFSGCHTSSGNRPSLIGDNRSVREKARPRDKKFS